ncbi:hypothetical protein NDU88_007915 [Pleurodeles waltl]|uniref:Uncharacterized protein n=1 Tax=Pleurodeles waltl TaxID=8319 RepID=A0AAV7NUI2_PLEWA|nr:hypothetical protein NDU88_007915 [Pleurodeles waltl]
MSRDYIAESSMGETSNLKEKRAFYRKPVKGSSGLSKYLSDHPKNGLLAQASFMQEVQDMGGEQKRGKREEGDGGEGEPVGGRESYRRCEQRTQEDHRAVRTTRGREEGEDQEAGGPDLGQQEQTPGRRARQPAMLQEKRGRARCVEVA